jgi:hypothetical protein
MAPWRCILHSFFLITTDTILSSSLCTPCTQNNEGGKDKMTICLYNSKVEALPGIENLNSSCNRSCGQFPSLQSLNRVWNSWVMPVLGQFWKSADKWNKKKKSEQYMCHDLVWSIHVNLLSSRVAGWRRWWVTGSVVEPLSYISGDPASTIRVVLLLLLVD